MSQAPADPKTTTKRRGLRIIEALMEATDEEDVYRGLRRELRDPVRGEKIMAAVEAITRDPPGWKWEHFRQCWERGSDKIYPVNGEFVISSGDVWQPGSFETFEEAEKAINGE